MSSFQWQTLIESWNTQNGDNFFVIILLPTTVTKNNVKKESHKTILLCPFDRYFFRKKKQHTNEFISLWWFGCIFMYGECIVRIVCVVTRNTFSTFTIIRTTLCSISLWCVLYTIQKYHNEWHTMRPTDDEESNQFFYFTQETHQIISRGTNNPTLWVFSVHTHVIEGTRLTFI